MIEHLTGGGLIMDLGILSQKQNEVLERLKKSVISNKLFPNLFYLAGGTGLALMLAHRKSDDFDFFLACTSHLASCNFSQPRRTGLPLYF